MPCSHYYWTTWIVIGSILWGLSNFSLCIWIMFMAALSNFLERIGPTAEKRQLEAIMKELKRVCWKLNYNQRPLSWTNSISQFPPFLFILFFLIVCFTSYFVFNIAVLPHSPGVVYHHLLLRQETRIPGVAPLLFSNRNLGSFCA